MHIESLRWNDFLQYDKRDWNTQEMREIIHHEMDECVKAGYRMFFELDFEDLFNENNVVGLKTKNWEVFLEKYGSCDWNTPELRYTIKREFDNCASEGN